MTYYYYPGCSLSASAMEYDQSTRLVMKSLDQELLEIPDWTCCGATAAEAVGQVLAHALPARVLALAEKEGKADEILVPCSACYLNLKKAEVEKQKRSKLAAKVDKVLAEEGLSYSGGIKVRHLLDVLAHDLGEAKLTAQITRSLSGLVVAPYYGCQALRPFAEFDNPERPRSMEGIIRATGAASLVWEMSTACCGASNMTTKPKTAMELVGKILGAARGADLIVTVCPMCQLNLEGFQKEISRLKQTDLTLSILYLPQLLGLAMGLSPKDIMLDKNLAITANLKERLTAA